MTQAGPERPALDTRPRRESVALEVDPGGRWRVAWDPWTGQAARGRRGQTPAGAPAEPQAVLRQARWFAEQHARLLGSEDAELRRVRFQHQGRAWHVTWQQWDQERRVLGSFLDLTLTESGHVVFFQSTLVPVEQAHKAVLDPETARGVLAGVLGQPVRIRSQEPVVVVWPEEGRYETRPALRVDLDGQWGGRWEAVLESPGGRIFSLESRIRYAGFEGRTRAEVSPLYAQDVPEIRLLPWLEVALRGPVETFETTSNEIGFFRFDLVPSSALQLEATLDGLYARVRNQAGDPQARFTHPVEVPGARDVHFGDPEARLDERTIYYHTNVIHDYMRSRFDFRLMDFPLPATASARGPMTAEPDLANAFWDGEGIYFGNGADVYHNFGLFADVIYHEYTHGSTDFAYGPIPLRSGAIHEGVADYFACTITDDPLLGENLSRIGGEAFRNLENDLKWPQDRVGEVHGDGEILGGALWDVRRQVGPLVTDALVHFARFLYPQTFEAYADAMLVQDDLLFGDGRAANGSPHENAILAAFALHGIGPLAGLPRRLVHQPLRDTEDLEGARDVRIGFEYGLWVATDSLFLHYAVDTEPFRIETMQREMDGVFHAQIPAQASGTIVRYYSSAKGRRGTSVETHPENAPENVHVYRVGPDLEPPLVQHVPRTRASRVAWPVEILVGIDDNLGLAHAYAEYLQNGVPGPRLGLAGVPGEPGLYRGRFPGPGVLGDTIEYWIVAVDASRGANSTRFPVTGSLDFEIVHDLQEGFEVSDAGWFAPRPWHLTSSWNHTTDGRRGWLCGAEDMEYAPGIESGLVTERYRVFEGARAVIWSWMDAETNGPFEAFDAGIVQIRSEDGAWELLTPVGGYTHRVAETGGGSALPPGTPCLSGRETAWRPLEFDLASWAGQSVRLRFVFASDDVASPFGYRGWALDDFELEPGEQQPTASLPGSARRRLLDGDPAPNPFAPRLSFRLVVPEEAESVRVSMFDVRGRLIRVVWDAALPPGPQELSWDGRTRSGLAVASGVYYYEVRSGLGVERGTVVRRR